MKKTDKFRPGKAGCESLLFIVRGYHPGTDPTTTDGDPAPMDTLRICAVDVFEVAQHLKKWEPNFSVRSIRLIGLTVLLSGSPYQE